MTAIILGLILVIGVGLVQYDADRSAEAARETVSSEQLQDASLATPIIPDFSVPRSDLVAAKDFCSRHYAGKKRVIRLCKRIQMQKAGQIERAKYRNWVKKHKGEFSTVYWMTNIEPQLVIAKAYMKASHATIKETMQTLSRLLPKKRPASDTKMAVKASWSWWSGTTYRVTYNRNWSAKAAGKYLTEGVAAASLALCAGVGTIGPLRVGILAAGGCTALMSGVTARYKDVMKEVRNDSSTCLQVSVSYGMSQLKMFGNLFHNPSAVPCVWK